ncbi:interleukin-6 receptor subunit alpha isoform X2 [Sander lucioperca]|uniref:interleukin-6 receptor subunit alpha isoform X2 n=1 Tax=Sander lucioperca TaxID=283035 RepID=UPI00125D67B2|nr:interleukin-6 receptor subunit alpha isoform X2 [Sander lucioperca]
MRIILPLLCVLCATAVHGIFDGTCPRKDPPPGVLVLSPGSSLVLTCSGHVEVDGVKVSMARQGSNTNRGGSSSDSTPTTTVNIRSNTEVSMKSDKHTVENTVSEGYHPDLTDAGENRSLGRTATGYTASPTTHTVWQTSVSRLLKDESDWEAKEMDGESDYEKEGDEGSRVTRGIKSRLQWKWNSRTVGKGDRDWGEITFERRRASLSLSSVRLTDSGRYSCYHRGRERFSLKVNVADPPENPSLSCYKRSPSSKIRCEWAPQKPITIKPNCYLLLSKSPAGAFHRSQCSYSSRRSRCWCALEHNWDELRTLHMAYLCVTSIAGNATSALRHFIPMDILKPDPPSDVSVRQEEGQEMRMTVNWSLPISWMPHDHYYKLIYEIQYRPLKSSFWQIHRIEDRSYTITDAIPGVEYLIQLRTRDEYDGQWSDWSTPASRWTVAGGQTPSPWIDATTFPVYLEGSGTDEDVSDVPQPSSTGVGVSCHILWISCGSLVLLSVILAAYIFRHKDRFMSKLQSLSVITQWDDCTRPPPSTPTPPEGQALVTFAPVHCQEPPLSKVEKEEEENEEQWVKEKIEAMHFNNTSYFFILRE